MHPSILSVPAYYMILVGLPDDTIKFQGHRGNNKPQEISGAQRIVPCVAVIDSGCMCSCLDSEKATVTVTTATV